MRYLIFPFLAGLLCAQGTDPKSKAGEYEVNAAAPGIEIGAEYMVHSFSGDGQTFLAPDYLVVEVALFPPKGANVTAGAGQFKLRIDGKTVLSPASPQTVATSLQRQGWNRTRGVDAGGQVGPVVLGSPQQVPPYGGGPGRTPAPRRIPDPDYGSGLPPREPVKADELVVRTALPDGVFGGPVSGYVYFRFQGKASKLKSVDLLCQDLTLKLK